MHRLFSVRQGLAGCAALLLAVSCREPMSVERFVGGAEPYVFTVDMGDTTAVYDFDLYTRIDDRPEVVRDLKELHLQISWTSPSDTTFRGDVYMPMNGRVSFFSRQARAPYRAGVRPSEAGEWTISIRTPEAPQGLQGMGLCVRKKR